jgi:hypothetical protein
VSIGGTDADEYRKRRFAARLVASIPPALIPNRGLPAPVGVTRRELAARVEFGEGGQ